MNEANSISFKRRPLYETESDRANEREAIAQIEFQFGSEIEQTQQTTLVDAVMSKGGIDWAYVELKCRDSRHQAVAEVGGYMISMIKWDRLQGVAKNDKPVLLVVTFGPSRRPDEAYGLWVDHATEYPTGSGGRLAEREGRGRTELEKELEKEKCYFIPWEEFREVMPKDSPGSGFSRQARGVLSIWSISNQRTNSMCRVLGSGRTSLADPIRVK